MLWKNGTEYLGVAGSPGDARGEMTRCDVARASPCVTNSRAVRSDLQSAYTRQGWMDGDKYLFQCSRQRCLGWVGHLSTHPISSGLVDLCVARLAAAGYVGLALTFRLRLVIAVERRTYES